MKNIIKIILGAAFIFLISFQVSAQKQIKEGAVTYELTGVDSESPEMQMMKGSTMKIVFNKKKQKFEMDMMGGLVAITTIMDLEKEESVTLSNMMGKKILVKMNKEEYEKQKAKKDVPDYEITYDKSDTKEIAGYKCYKAVLKDSSGNVLNTYVTEDVKIKVNHFEQMFPGLKVFPLEFSMGGAGMSMLFSAQEFVTKLDSDEFEYTAEDYEEMTMEEFEKSMGGMGGMGL